MNFLGIHKNRKRKDTISVEIKNKVWKKCSIYPLNREITKCYTCDNFVLIPESIRHLNEVSYNIQTIYGNGKKININGVGEFGHIISEYNGGKVCEESENA